MKSTMAGDLGDMSRANIASALLFKYALLIACIHCHLGHTYVSCAGLIN